MNPYNMINLKFSRPSSGTSVAQSFLCRKRTWARLWGVGQNYTPRKVIFLFENFLAIFSLDYSLQHFTKKCYLKKSVNLNCRGDGFYSIGNSIENVEPQPGVLCTEIFPSQILIIRFTSASPKPLPSSFLEESP